MSKLVFIDACFRGEESRTLAIAKPIVEYLSSRYEVETFHLPQMKMEPVDTEYLNKRNGGFVYDWALSAAKSIASADRIVIAAPFWDMSFPSALKVFFEHASLFNVTFTDTGVRCAGLCKCEKLLYITTRGMDIETGSPLEQATPYLEALSYLWGLGQIITVSAQNLDYSTPEQINEKIEAAIEQGLNIVKTF